MHNFSLPNFRGYTLGPLEHEGLKFGGSKIYTMILGTVGGILLFSMVSVYLAMVSGETFLCGQHLELPCKVLVECLQRHHCSVLSSRTPLTTPALVLQSVLSIRWSASRRISSSTIGKSQLSCQAIIIHLIIFTTNRKLNIYLVRLVFKNGHLDAVHKNKRSTLKREI